MHAIEVKNILIVDDNIGDLMLYHEAISDLSGYAIHTAMDVLQARAFLEQQPPFAGAPTPHLVFLDLRLPIFPGYCLLPFIRGNPVLTHLKVVVFTSSESHGDRRRCTELGADEYVVKPLEWDQWRDLVARILTRHGGLADDDSTWKATARG